MVCLNKPPKSKGVRRAQVSGQTREKALSARKPNERQTTPGQNEMEEFTVHDKTRYDRDGNAGQTTLDGTENETDSTENFGGGRTTWLEKQTD